MKVGLDKLGLGQGRIFAFSHRRHVYDSQKPVKCHFTSSLPTWESEPALCKVAAELTHHHHVLQILLGGAAIIGGIFAGTWLYMSTKQARKASREPGEKGALPSC